MSTSPEQAGRAEDRIVSVLATWLGRHVPADRLRSELEAFGTEGLRPEHAEAVDELLAELRRSDRSRGGLEMVVRETIETIVVDA